MIYILTSSLLDNKHLIPSVYICVCIITAAFQTVTALQEAQFLHNINVETIYIFSSFFSSACKVLQNYDAGQSLVAYKQEEVVMLFSRFGSKVKQFALLFVMM